MDPAPTGGDQPELQPEQAAQPTHPADTAPKKKRKHRRGEGKRRQLHRFKAAPGKRASAARKADDIEREKRLGKIIDLRVEGHTIRAIGAKLKLSISVVHKEIEEALERIIDRNDAQVRTERAISLERIEVATRGIFPRLKKGDCEAINAFAKLDARRAKLLGLDVPIKAELTGPDGGAIPIAAPTSQLESKLDDLYKRLVGGASAADAATAPAASTGSEHAGNEPGGSAGAQSGSSP